MKFEHIQGALIVSIALHSNSDAIAPSLSIVSSQILNLNQTIFLLRLLLFDFLISFRSNFNIEMTPVNIAVRIKSLNILKREKNQNCVSIKVNFV